MKEKDLLSAVRMLMRNAAGFDADKFAQARKEAYDHYHQRPRGDEVTGRSQVVAGDISAMTEATLSQMMDAFDSDRIAEFQALDAFDESQAQLEADTIQRLVMQGANNGFLTIATSTKDALLERNGVAKVYVEEKIKKQTREFENVAVEALGEMKSQLDEAGIEHTVHSFDPDTGDLRITTKVLNQVLRVKSLDPANFLYTENWDGVDFQGMQAIPFCAERHVEARSELIARGFPKKKVMELQKFHVETKPDVNAKDVQESVNPQSQIDESQELVEWYECYVLMDEDGDGISERHCIAVGGESQNVLLKKWPARLVPFAVGIVILNPHRITGISLVDKLRQIQDKSTGLERALMDNVNAVVRSRLAYLDGKVNQDDLDSGRVNGDVRVRNSVQDIRQAIMAIQVPDLTDGLLKNIQHQASQRAEMGGAALDLATGNMQLNERLGSQGLDRAYSVMEQLSALMTKLVATTLVRSIFLLAHATLRLEFKQPIPTKRHGRWITVKPSDWPVREEITIRPGSSPNERARQVGALKEIIATQTQLAAQGLDDVILDVNSFYTAIMDWCRIQDLPNPEKYWLDPKSPESVAAIERKQEAAMLNEQAQGKFMEQAVELEQLRTAFDKYKQDTDLQFKYWEAILKSETEEARIVGSVTGDLVKAQNGQNTVNNSTEKRTNDDNSSDARGDSREVGASE